MLIHILLIHILYLYFILLRIISNMYKEIIKKLSTVKYVPLKEIKRRDDPGKWYTLGVMVGKSSVKKTANGDNYAMIQLGNLNNIITNIFVFGNNLKKIENKKIGQILAICHAKTMIPSEVKKKKNIIILYYNFIY